MTGGDELSGAGAGRIAWLFPGVGSEYPGMGRWLVEDFATARQVFEEARDVLGTDLLALHADPLPGAPAARLEAAQVGVLTVSYATARVVAEELGLQPAAVLGHSLGELTALCVAGALPFAATLELARARSKILAAAAAVVDGKMAWVVNLDADRAGAVCAELGAAGRQVFVSAHDAPTQVTITGRAADVVEASGQLERAGALVYALPLAGPFHSPLMHAAAAEFDAVLQRHHFAAPELPVLANCSGRPYASAAAVAAGLSRQLVEPLRWRESMAWLVGRGIHDTLEIGPKRVLAYLVAKNSPMLRAFTTDTRDDLAALRRAVAPRPADRLAMFGRCLGAVAAARNERLDAAAYETRVAVPFSRVECLYRGLAAAGTPPTMDQLRQGLQMVADALEAKGTPVEQRRQLLVEVLDGHLVAGASPRPRPR